MRLFCLVLLLLLGFPCIRVIDKPKLFSNVYNLINFERAKDLKEVTHVQIGYGRSIP